MTDVLAASYTIPAAQIIDPGYNATPAMNLYFMIASTLVIAVAFTIVTEKIVAPMYENLPFERPEETVSTEVTPVQKKGLKWAGAAKSGSNARNGSPGCGHSGFPGLDRAVPDLCAGAQRHRNSGQQETVLAF